MSITWNFSNDQGRATHIFTAGFQAYGPAIPIGVLAQESHDDIELTLAGGYVTTLTLEIPETEVGLLAINLSGSFADAANIAMELGGQALTVSGDTFQTTGDDAFHVVGYLWIGDQTMLDDHVLTITVTGLAGPTVQACLQSAVIEGIQQGVATVYDAGTLNTFTRELTIDPEISEVGAEFVFAGAAQALDGEGTLIAVSDGAGYTLATSTQANAAVAQNTAWLFPNVSFDCDCGEASLNAMTLAQVRNEVLALTGYAAQLALLPPGIETKYNAMIRRAQTYLYDTHKAMEVRRYFSWTLKPGVRYYGIYDNKNDCQVTLDRYSIAGAWIQDLNNTWWPLRYGIDPVAYTLEQNFGWPTNFEVRECIEVFPAPQDAYRLWIRGAFDLPALTDDADSTTLNAQPIINFATFLVKSDKGTKDADIYEGLAETGINRLIAGCHAIRRYIPGTIERPIPTPPVMLEYIGSP